jgi:hypothetical protein
MLISRSAEDGKDFPKWMISINAGGELFSSSITANEQAKNCIPLYGFHISVRRYTTADLPSIGGSFRASSGLSKIHSKETAAFTSMQLKHDDCVVLIPSGGHIAELENCLYKKKTVETVSLLCFNWFGGNLDIFQEISFQDSLVTAVEQKIDEVFVRFRVKKKTHSYTQYNSQTFAKGGVATCSMDFTKNA